MKKLLPILAFFLIPSLVLGVTTCPFTVDANTYALYLMNGAVGGAPKTDDESANNHDFTEVGTVVSTTGYTTPTSDGAYAFTNTGDKYVHAGDNADFPTGAISVEAWVYVNAGITDTEGVITKYNGSGDNTFYVQRTADTTFSFGVTNGAGTNFDTGNATVSTGAWHYIVGTYEPSTAIRLYVDGTEGAANTTSIPASIKDSAARLFVGNYDQTESTAANAFDGNVDSVKISNVTLSSGTISSYYDGTCGVPPSFQDFIWFE